jgi:hypothetical protein
VAAGSLSTVVFEYGYSETSHKLALNAACHLLLLQGLDQLVVMMDVKWKSSAQGSSMVLEKSDVGALGGGWEQFQGGRFLVVRRC